MDNYKFERIKNIKDEVTEFHPFLQALFNRLPLIDNVEYKQGTSEMGADFLLTKRDSTLNDIEYIGCIVKVGQIKQDHSEVNRQIEECEIERTIEGGVRKIFISEIWVITNGSITNNAQDKIHHKYKNKNIKFISGEKIVNLVDKYFPDFWTDIDINIGQYLRKTRDISDGIGNSSSLLDLNKSDVYVDQYIIKRITKRSFAQKSTPHKKTTINQVIKNDDFILLEAMMGTGKSTLIARLAKLYTESENFNVNRILPIIVTAKEIQEDYQSDIRKLVQNTKDSHKIEGEKGYLILIDGLDELKVTSNERLNFLRTLYESGATYSSIKVIVTSRSIDDPELEADIDKIFNRYDLCPLTIKQVVTLVDKFCKNIQVKTRLSKDLDKSHLFRVLPKTPISAILLAKLLNESVQEIPSTMTELYSKYMELVLGRWDMDKGLQSQSEYDIINNVTVNIAKFILENSLIEISIGDAKIIFDEYTTPRNFQIDKEKVFIKILEKTEIFKNNRSKNTISFRHRTFAEYFYALGMIRDSSAKINEDIYDLYWNTSYFFFIGMRRDCPELINAIDRIEFTGHKGRLLKIFNTGNFLLAAYLTPYEYIKKSTILSFREAATLYCEILSSKDENPLKELTAIQLLCIFTNSLCDTFGYNFFSESLEERALDICTLATLEDIDYAELFLINSTLITINKSTAYDKMIEHYGKAIPLQFQIGIMEHTSDKRSESSLVKRFSKNFFKDVKSNRSINSTIISLYEKPIKKLEKL